MFSTGAGKEDTNMPRATVQRRGANNTATFFVDSRKVFAHVPAPEDTSYCWCHFPSVTLSEDLPEKVGNSA